MKKQENNDEKREIINYIFPKKKEHEKEDEYI